MQRRASGTSLRCRSAERTWQARDLERAVVVSSSRCRQKRKPRLCQSSYTFSIREGTRNSVWYKVEFNSNTRKRRRAVGGPHGGAGGLPGVSRCDAVRSVRGIVCVAGHVLVAVHNSRSAAPATSCSSRSPLHRAGGGHDSRRTADAAVANAVRSCPTTYAVRAGGSGRNPVDASREMRWPLPAALPTKSEAWSDDAGADRSGRADSSIPRRMTP